MSQVVSKSISQLSVNTNPKSKITQDDFSIHSTKYFMSDINSRVTTTQDDIKIQETKWFIPPLVRNEKQITVGLITTNGRVTAAQYYRNYDRRDEICFKIIKIEYGLSYSPYSHVIITAPSNHGLNSPCRINQLVPSLFSFTVVEKGMEVFVADTSNSLHVNIPPSVAKKDLYLSLPNGVIT